VEPISLAKSVLDMGRTITQGLRRVRVRTHYAHFVGSPVLSLFVNVVNLGQRPITITHVWFDGHPRVHVENPKRPLPKRLDPDDPWETWVPVSVLSGRFEERDRDRLLRSARVRLSTGRVVKARPNPKVPERGAVPGP
jgi:hypothetical protein